MREVCRAQPRAPPSTAGGEEKEVVSQAMAGTLDFTLKQEDTGALQAEDLTYFFERSQREHKFLLVKIKQIDISHNLFIREKIQLNNLML